MEQLLRVESLSAAEQRALAAEARGSRPGARVAVRRGRGCFFLSASEARARLSDFAAWRSTL